MDIESLKVRPLKKSEEEEFKELTTYYIAQWYDDIDDSFAQIILDAHKSGFDPLGYFTKNKTIWVAEYDGKMAGFLVGTEKRGGSVKLAPGIMKPEYQRKGLGTKLWQNVEDIYRKKGARKIYNHAPLYRFELLKWVTRLGLSLEGHLHEHYREGQDEYVAGKLLNETVPTKIETQRWSGQHTDHSIRDYRDGDKKQFKKIILQEMLRWYDEIDSSFVESILSARKQFDKTFQKKGKKVFVVEDKGELIGCCVATPKRGGAVKLVPFLFLPEKGTFEAASDLLYELESFFSKSGYRKLYASLPVYDLDSCLAFRNHGFQIEGYIKEPYKTGVDNLFYGKLIRKTQE